jgi:hypothetical protein
MIRGETAQVAAGFTPWWSGTTHRQVHGDRLNTCLTDSVARQFTVDCLIDSNFIGWSEDPVLFHAGD